MNITRHIHRTLTYIPRVCHRHGFGVQSPSDFELVRDVLFERLAYYAYDEQNLKKESERQLYRLKLRYGNRLICADDKALDIFEELANSDDDSRLLLIEHISGRNLRLWKKVLVDSRARVTYDLGNRGLVLFDKKRIKQNYLL